MLPVKARLLNLPGLKVYGGCVAVVQQQRRTVFKGLYAVAAAAAGNRTANLHAYC